MTTALTLAALCATFVAGFVGGFRFADYLNDRKLAR